MPMQCGHCGSEWFSPENQVKIAAEPFISGGVPRFVDSRPSYRCVTCGTVLDISRLEVEAVTYHHIEDQRLTVFRPKSGEFTAQRKPETLHPNVTTMEPPA